MFTTRAIPLHRPRGARSILYTVECADWLGINYGDRLYVSVHSPTLWHRQGL